MPNHQVEKQIFEWEPGSHKSCGRPRQHRMNCVEKICIRMAADMYRFRRMLEKESKEVVGGGVNH